MSKRNENRPGYRKTEVGWIPEEWKCMALADVALIQTGISKSSNRILNDSVTVPYLRVANVQDGFLDLSELKNIEIEKRDLDRFLLKKGDVLFTEGGDFDKLGRGTIWEGQVLECVHQNHIFVARVNGGKLLPYFLTKLASSWQGRRYFILSSKQSTNLASINSTQLKAFPLPIPPLPEQKKIAEILSTWDEAIDQTRNLIDAKKRRKKALMQQLLTGKRRLPGFSGKWRACSFKDYFKRIVRKNTKSCENALTISGPLGLINQEHYFKKRIAAQDLTSYYLIKKGEFAYNKSYCKGYPLGAIKMLDRYNEGVVSTLYICFRSKEGDGVHREFMKYYFESGVFNKELYSIAQEGARNHGLLNVNAQDFFATKLLLPLKDEQIAITDLLTTVGKEIKTLEQKLAALEKQKRGLMQKLLTGEVRVRI